MIKTELEQAVEQVGYNIGYNIGRRLKREANAQWLLAPLSIDTMWARPRVTPGGIIWDVVAESTHSMIR